MIVVIAYVSTAVVFALLDAIWLTTMIDRFYRPILRDVLLPTYNLPAALAFYLTYVSGIVVLAILPSFPNAGISQAVSQGALIGLFAFATYDLTNLSTLRNWTWTLCLVDIAWGTFLTATASTAGYLAVRALGQVAN
jgi:uncharacterized membrane protein